MAFSQTNQSEINSTIDDVTVTSLSSQSNVLTNYTGLLPFNNIDVICFTIFTVVFMVFGIAANLLTLAVIVNSRKLRSIFHFFIFGLCVSDTVSALISWINLYRRTWGFDDFALSNFACTFYWAIEIWTSYSTALHILSFAALRLISIKLPHRMGNIKNGYPIGLIWIILIWIVTFLAGAVPFGIIHGVEYKNRSLALPNSKWPSCTLLLEWSHFYSKYTLFAFPIFFYLPIFLTVCFSSSIIILMLRNQSTVKSHISPSGARARRKKEKNAVMQLALIVTSFMIGYIPFTVFEFYTIKQRKSTYDNWWIDWHFGTTQYMLLRFSECLNPIFYNLGSKTMWRETKKFLSQRCRCFWITVEPTSFATTTWSTMVRGFVKS